MQLASRLGAVRKHFKASSPKRLRTAHNASLLRPPPGAPRGGVAAKNALSFVLNRFEAPAKLRRERARGATRARPFDLGQRGLDRRRRKISRNPSGHPGGRGTIDRQGPPVAVSGETARHRFRLARLEIREWLRRHRRPPFPDWHYSRSFDLLVIGSLGYCFLSICS